LTEDFIREFSDKVDWDWISYSQNLSENFVREFQDKVNWKDIFKHQNLSESFIREFKDKFLIAFPGWKNLSDDSHVYLLISEFKASRKFERFLPTSRN
jgi:hypothetical protein